MPYDAEQGLVRFCTVFYSTLQANSLSIIATAIRWTIGAKTSDWQRLRKM
jgi:hypothetical protein